MHHLYSLLVTNALMSAIVLLLAAMACKALFRSSAAHRHLIWSLAFASLLVVPVAATLLSPFLPAQAEPKRVPTVTVTQGASTAAPRAAEGAERAPLPWKSTLFVIWLAGAAILAVRTAIGLSVCHLRRRRSTPFEPADMLAADLLPQLGLTPRTQVLESAEVSVPETFGFIRPVVLVPRAARQWSEDRLRLVVLHEFVHIQRGDWTIQVAARTATSLFWFNPLCWYALRRLCDEREVACDDGVLRLGIAQSEYAHQLIEIAKGARVKAPALAVAMVRPNLEGRIRSILNPQQNRRSITLKQRIFTLVPAMLVAAAASLVTSPAQTGSASIRGTVRDVSGAVVPQAEVVLSNGKAQEVARTSDVGAYDFSGFADGKYTLKVMKPGFVAFERRVDLAAASPAQHDVTLDLGRLVERIEVTAQGQPRVKMVQPSGTGPIRIRVGGHVQAAKIEHSVLPVYPASLVAQGVEGIVLLQAIVGTQGQIVNVQAANSHVDAELVSAATEAVKQWRYRPTLLNGQPVEVLTTITVDFRLKP